MSKEKAFFVKNNLNQWIAIVCSLSKPGEKHFDKIWVEEDSEECIIKLMNLE
jgi:hypothetical protein